MTEPVKGTRRYNSPRRREQAAETRRQILASAQALFERGGFAGTSMAAIASAAGVSFADSTGLRGAHPFRRMSGWASSLSSGWGRPSAWS